LKEILENFQKDSVNAVDRRLEGIRVEFNWLMKRGEKPNADLEVRPSMATQNQGVPRGFIVKSGRNSGTGRSKQPVSTLLAGIGFCYARSLCALKKN
jgi:hypothetical protein